MLLVVGGCCGSAYTYWELIDLSFGLNPLPDNCATSAKQNGIEAQERIAKKRGVGPRIDISYHVKKGMCPCKANSQPNMEDGGSPLEVPN